jgi:hypothetical protein
MPASTTVGEIVQDVFGIEVADTTRAVDLSRADIEALHAEMRSIW